MQEAIALLWDLAERGELDPWNVDVIDVIDRFLSQLALTDRQDLQESGQALLYGAMLVQLKAKTLDQAVELIVSEEETPELSTDPLPPNLEQVLQRRTSAPPPQARPVTLAELIAQIEEIAQVVAQKTEKTKKHPLRQGKAVRRAVIKAIAQLAHKENLSETVLALENYLSRYDPAHTPILEIHELAQALQDPVGVFWGLLLLSAQNKVELFQRDFYGKIYIKIKNLAIPQTGLAQFTIEETHSLVWQEVS